MIDRIKKILDRKMASMAESHTRPSFYEVSKINRLRTTVDFLDRFENGGIMLEEKLKLLHRLLDVGDILIDKEVRDYIEKEKVQVEREILKRKPGTDFVKRPVKHVRRLRIPDEG